MNIEENLPNATQQTFQVNLQNRQLETLHFTQED
jgi:hypothetical protein